MDEQRFDGLSKQLGASSRRRVLLGVVAAAVPGLLSQRPTAATSKRHQRHQAGRGHGPTKASSPNAGPPQPVDLTVDLMPAQTGCPFTVEYHLTGDTKVITLASGLQIITNPKQYVTFTNLDNGKQITLNVTGPFRVTTQANGDLLWVVMGRNVLIDAFPVPPAPKFGLALGQFTFTTDATGTQQLSDVTGNGQRTDLCPLLA